MSSFAFVCTGRLLIVVLVLLLSISVKGEEAASTSIESDQGATRTKKALGLKGMVLEAKEKLAEEHKQSKKRPKSLRHPKVQQGGLLPSMDRNSNYTSGGSPGSWIHSQASVHTCGVRGVTKNGTVVTRPLRIIMSTTASYVPTLFNWLLYYRQICPDMSSLFFLCMDRDSEKMMQKYGLRCDHYHGAKSRNKMWLTRTQIASSLLADGYDVLMSDLDAIWLRNPFVEVEKHYRSQVIASRAEFPEDVSRRYGATLCLGFAYIKSTKPSKALWTYLADAMGRNPKPDDQRVLNQMLLEIGLRFPRHLTMYNSTVADTGAVRLRRYIKQGSGLSPPNEANTLRVTLLPHEPFRRMGCENRSAVAIQAMRQSTVLHCLLHEKNGNLKQSGSRDLGIWQLRERWMDVPFRENDTIDSFLDNIRIDVAERATSVLLSSYEYKSDNSDKLMV